MSTISSFIKHHALVTFFALAYALSWSLSLSEPHSILPLGPLLAALLVLPLTDGWAGVKDFLRRIVRWRVGPRWYLLVLGLPVALFAVALGLNVLLGAPAPMWGHVPPLSELPMTFLGIALLIGLGEEPAWRGFALPRLTTGRSALAGSLLLWVLHAVWHLPLFGLEYDFQNGLPWLIMLLGGTIFSTWLYYRTNGNLLLPLLFHTSVNVGAKYLFNPLFAGADTLRLWWLVGALWLLVGCALVLVAGRELGHTPAEPAEATRVARTLTS
jgi:membrane protease YdiL (CAAX protease family)